MIHDEARLAFTDQWKMDKTKYTIDLSGYKIDGKSIGVCPLIIRKKYSRGGMDLDILMPCGRVHTITYGAFSYTRLGRLVSPPLPRIK